MLSVQFRSTKAIVLSITGMLMATKRAITHKLIRRLTMLYMSVRLNRTDVIIMPAFLYTKFTHLARIAAH